MERKECSEKQHRNLRLKMKTNPNMKSVACLVCSTLWKKRSFYEAIISNGKFYNRTFSTEEVSKLYANSIAETC